MDFLEVKNLKKNYGNFSLDVSFSVAEGEFLSIIGPSGSGKSTVLSMLAGLEKPDDGIIVLDGDDITDKGIRDRKIGLVFQDYALFSNMNVEKNVQYGMDRKKLGKRKDIKAYTEMMLERVNLSGYEKRKVTSLSGGEAQRVALARSLATEPKVLLLDEPLSALDAPLRKKLRSNIRDIHNRTGVTVIYVTHDREEAFAISDRIIIMKDGHIVEDGTPEKVYTRPSSSFAATFTGDCTLLPASMFMEGKQGHIFFRPESVMISDEAVNPQMYSSYLVINNVTIQSVEYTGSHYLLCVEYLGHYILALSLVKPKKQIISVMINKDSISLM